MVRKKRGEEFEPLGVGLVDGDFEGEPVALAVGPHGDGEGRWAAFLPGSIARLHPDAQEALAELQEHVHGIRALQLVLDEAVVAAREIGISWSAIGWSVGLTGEGARRRWGLVDGDE